MSAKRLFFDQLSALNETSDEEDDTNDIRDVFRKSKKLSSPQALSSEFPPQNIRTPITINKMPGFQRTISAPLSSASLVKETPLPPSLSSLGRSESAALLSSEIPVVEDTPEPNLHVVQRTASSPTLGTGTLVLNYSTGIESMLGKRNRTGLEPLHAKKKLRKESSIKLVPEDEQIFKGQIFYYIPPDDKAPLRRTRINKAREFGATWTREFTPATTHIVVDKGITFKDVMAFLRLETLPSNTIMVSEEYPIDSIKCRFLLDPRQKLYAIDGHPETLQEENTPDTTSQKSNKSLELKASKRNPGTRDHNPPNQTPPRSENSTQVSQGKENARELLPESSEGVWLAQNTTHTNSVVAESPQETSHHAGIICETPESVWLRDELDEMIKVARSMKDVPIDDEEDDHADDRPPSCDDPDDSGSDDEPRRPSSRSAPKSKLRGSNKGPFNQDKFTCMTGGTGVTPESNPNARTIEVLQKMADYYVQTKDHWRQTAYRKAIGTLRRQTDKIATYEEALNLPTIGNRLALKIEEIVLTNGLRRLENAMMDSNYHTLQLFMNIYGVGINQAWKWVQQGHKTLEDLKSHAHLTDNQRLGIEHYDDFLTRIPRDEVTALGNVVSAAAAALDPKVEVIIGGSYRRGASSSGDIDCLLTKPSTSSSQELLGFLNQLISKLTESKFLVAALSVPSQSGSKWHGCCVLPGASKPIWRRIDFLLVPETQLGAALIYFTGDDIFNRSIRLLSSRKGWRLNQRGLYKDVMRGPGRVKMTEGTLIESADERKIFAALGVPWRPPEQRICH